MAVLSLNIAVVVLCLASLCSYLVSTCNIHSGLQFYSCTKYSRVSYSQPYKCGFWYWQRCYRTKYTHSAHHTTCFRSCRVNGGWNSWQAWGAWSSCDRACGRGRRVRYGVRECNNPSPKNGGARCPGSHIRKNSGSCLLKHCPVNGAWSSWKAWAVWSSCDKTCGNGRRTRQRARVCNNPSPKYGGLPCRGSHIKRESGFCLRKHCPVNGSWSVYGPWGKFSECSKTCGAGAQSRYRHRTCNNPKPQYGGRNCTGPSIKPETSPCNTNPC
eukprot:XP_011445797.1 PREDICTED: coadhesin [Crassostrea gigas]